MQCCPRCEPLSGAEARGCESACADSGGPLSPGSAFAQAVHAQHDLLLDRLDGHEVHLRPTGGFADGRSIVGVVLAAGTPLLIGADELRGDDACVQPQGDELACPVVQAGAGLPGHDAAGGQLRAPGDEFIAWQRAAGRHLADRINGMDLDHALGEIDPTPTAWPRASPRAPKSSQPSNSAMSPVLHFILEIKQPPEYRRLPQDGLCEAQGH